MNERMKGKKKETNEKKGRWVERQEKRKK